ncbi:toxin secretion ABC transporter ATP-binding protein [Calothrix parasitica NIES-267]|uniref:Toxin secretion ABC transporter ATP-binding protein n=1 Tax=Calothrix parasitica NIES-267 TaxID=1973488 RepID=A0A1Z4LTL9_9CYAN|nr:toxin secretion ABC transporter ATP-binding protein [Calothrix parasitica NIES-267]
MVSNSICISDILNKTTPPFNRLLTATLKRLTQKSQLLRYQMGQQIAVKESIPAQIAILCQVSAASASESLSFAINAASYLRLRHYLSFLKNFLLFFLR